jgi:acetyl-CoA synthetase
MDDDGYFYYQGRDDDLIKISGVVVGPTEIEEVLRRHPAIADAGIIGKMDPMKGNILKAFISLKPGFAPSEELESEIKEFVKKYFSPRIVQGKSIFGPRFRDQKTGKWSGGS